MDDRSSKPLKSSPQKPSTTPRQGEVTQEETTPNANKQNTDQKDTTCGSIASSIYAFFHTIIHKISGDVPDMKFEI